MPSKERKRRQKERNATNGRENKQHKEPKLTKKDWLAQQSQELFVGGYEKEPAYVVNGNHRTNHCKLSDKWTSVIVPGSESEVRRMIASNSIPCSLCGSPLTDCSVLMPTTVTVQLE